MERETAYVGQMFTIAFARMKSGQSPGAAFYDLLPMRNKAKLNNLFRQFGEHGRIGNEEKFSMLETGLFEFKSFQVRLPCAYAHERGLLLITHGFYKKRDKTRKQEIERARKIFREDREQAKLQPDKKKGL